VQREPSDAGVDLARHGALLEDRVATQFDQPLDTVLHAVVQPVRDDVDDAAGRAAPVEQGGRAAHHLDLVGERRVDGHGVVLGQPRRVERREPVGQHLYPVAAEPANDGTGGHRAEERGVHAGFRGDRLADGRG